MELHVSLGLIPFPFGQGVLDAEGWQHSIKSASSPRRICANSYQMDSY